MKKSNKEQLIYCTEQFFLMELISGIAYYKIRIRENPTNFNRNIIPSARQKDIIEKLILEF